MNNLVFGFLTIGFCAIGYYYSWSEWRKDNYRIAIVLLVICGLALRLFVSTDFFLHEWDERYHALVAKNLIRHPFIPTLYNNPILPYDFKNWGGNYIWVHKQPLPLWSMAASMWMFGVNEIALRLPSIVLSSLGIWLTFSIASYLCNKKIAYLAALLFSINGLIIELTGGRTATDHIDIFFLFFVELAIFFTCRYAQRKTTICNILAGISIGAAILSKWLPALIVVPIWLLIVIDSGNFKIKTILIQFGVLLTTCLLVFLPWQLYIYNKFPVEAAWESNLNIRHFTEVLDQQTGSVLYFLDRIRISYGELIYLPLFWFLWRLLKSPNHLKNWAIAIWFVVPVVFFSLAKTKMQAYILFACPPLFMMTADFWVMLYGYRDNHKPKWLFNLIMILLIALPVRYTIERVKPFKERDIRPKWVSGLKALNEKKIQKGILLNYDRPVEAMFYTDITAYSTIPDKAAINDLLQRGYTIIINDKGNIPEEIKAIKGLIIEKIPGDY